MHLAAQDVDDPPMPARGLAEILDRSDLGLDGEGEAQLRGSADEAVDIVVILHFPPLGGLRQGEVARYPHGGA